MRGYDANTVIGLELKLVVCKDCFWVWLKFDDRKTFQDMLAAGHGTV